MIVRFRSEVGLQPIRVVACSIKLELFASTGALDFLAWPRLTCHLYKRDPACLFVCVYGSVEM